MTLYLDEDGLIRCRSRLLDSNFLSAEVKDPILLSKFSYFTRLVILDCHIRCKHLGTGTTLNAVRSEGFWIPHGRTLINKILLSCFTCRKFNANHFKYPKSHDLPADRVNYIRPFRNVGVDYTGFLTVRFGNEVSKMYILLYTCLNVRAVFLDLVPSMSNKHFLQSLIRFCNLFSMPKTLYSDNASTIISSLTILNNNSNDDELKEFLVKNNILHKKIRLYSVWVGASWERLIKVVKMSLHKTFGRKRLEYFELITLLSDISHAINSRPLMYNNSDDHNFHVITPNTFLKFETGGRLLFDNIVGDEIIRSTKKDLTSSFERREELMNKFQTLWHEEYLLALRSTEKCHNEGWVNRIRTGDLVLIDSPGKSRPFYQMGRVCKLLPGDDGVVRFVDVVRPDKTTGTYPISHLFPLELSVDDNTEVPALIREQKDFTPARPPRRLAAVKCRENLRKC